LRWPADWPRKQWSAIVGQQLFDILADHSRRAVSLYQEMMQGELVPAHCDLQPANFLIDSHRCAWVIDFEYASLAPPGWDPAKIVILSRRFGDPPSSDYLLDCWSPSALARIRDIALVQEVLLVSWLADMALNGTAGAHCEVRARSASLGKDARWRHLR